MVQVKTALSWFGYHSVIQGISDSLLGLDVEYIVARLADTKIDEKILYQQNRSNMFSLGHH